MRVGKFTDEPCKTCGTLRSVINGASHEEPKQPAKERYARRWEAACAALQGLLASESNIELSRTRHKAAAMNGCEYTEFLTREAVAIADALLAAFERPLALDVSLSANFPQGKSGVAKT